MTAETKRTELERFVLEYVEAAGGVWDEAEPQVYEVMLPPELGPALELPAGDVHRFAFDPEALLDYPSAQLMMFGNPSLERIFEDAQGRGRAARVYLPAGNIAPHDLRSRVARSLELGPGIELSLGPSRVYHLEACLFWFEATFISDEREQDIVSVGIERFHGRPVRHLEQTLRQHRVAPEPALPYPDAVGLSMPATYALAREEALRPLQVAAHARLTELQAGYGRQAERISAYFADLRTELARRVDRAVGRGEDRERFESQSRALTLEEQARLRELRQKLALRVQVRLLNLLHVVQPKLMLQLRLERAKQPPQSLTAVWDPLAQALEAVPCPTCGRPTLSLVSRGTLGCPACPDEPPDRRAPSRLRH